MLIIAPAKKEEKTKEEERAGPLPTRDWGEGLPALAQPFLFVICEAPETKS